MLLEIRDHNVISVCMYQCKTLNTKAGKAVDPDLIHFSMPANVQHAYKPKGFVLIIHF